MARVFPSDRLILSNTIPSDDCASLPDRAFASVTWPTTFAPREITVPSARRTFPAVLTTTSPPGFCPLASTEALRDAGMRIGGPFWPAAGDSEEDIAA